MKVSAEAEVSGEDLVLRVWLRTGFGSSRAPGPCLLPLHVAVGSFQMDHKTEGAPKTGTTATVPPTLIGDIPSLCHILSARNGSLSPATLKGRALHKGTNTKGWETDSPLKRWGEVGVGGQGLVGRELKVIQTWILACLTLSFRYFLGPSGAFHL